MAGTAAYFQGGDYVELLSAQGKTPASTWKLQGKITKTFEKTIKGNAFQLDGGTETKMQLPKSQSSQCLGLSQRFLVLQILIPYTRTLSIEIGFSDFQKIRRRFVVASAFRETVMNALHVQIPVGANVTRDQWMNLVFDLQALTEAFFAGSSFRSMESICISGSCRLKRIFTMKDAPACDLRSSRVCSAFAVARFADMKDIPKQFHFFSGNGPVPTEYFAITSGGINGESRSSVGKVGMQAASAIPPASKPDRVKSSVTAKNKTRLPNSRPSSTGNITRDHASKLQRDNEEKVALMRQPSATIKSPMAASDACKAKFFSPEVSSSTQSSTSPLHSFQLNGVSSISQRTKHDESEPSSPSVHAIDYKQSSRAGEVASTHVQGEQEANVLESPPPSSPTRLNTEWIDTGKKKHRETIFDEIQRKLDLLSENEEQASQRDHALYMQHTSIKNSVSSELELGTKWLSHDTEPIVNELKEANNDDEADQSVQFSNEWRRELSSSQMLHSRTRGEEDRDGTQTRKFASRTVKPSLSIFSFRRDADDSELHLRKVHQAEEPRILDRSQHLFDFDTLLSKSPEKNARSSTDRSTSSLKSHYRSQDQEVNASKTRPVEQAETVGMEMVQDEEQNSSSDDDHELTRLLAAKRSMRQQYARKVELNKLADSIREESDSFKSTPPQASIVSPKISTIFTKHEIGRLSTSEEIEISSVVERELCFDRENAENPNVVIFDDEVRDQDECSTDGDDLSLDLSDEMDASADSSLSDRQRMNNGNLDIDKHSESEGVGDDDEDNEQSFDFDDLVKEDPSNAADDANNADQPHRRSIDPLETKEFIDQINPQHSPYQRSPTSPYSKHIRSLLSESPIPHITRMCSPSKAISASSSRRLQHLLESTDWSHLSSCSETRTKKHFHGTNQCENPLSQCEVMSQTTTSSQLKSSSPMLKSLKASPSTASATSGSIDLIYDPLLQCYYDPIANKYYTLAK